MPTTRWRTTSRRLLAVCTFLVPLGFLAWLGGAELQRQGGQVEAAMEREGFVFLRDAARTIDEHLDRIIPAALKAAEGQLVGHQPHQATRELREHLGHPTVLDILLLDDRGSLVLPQPPPLDQGLPLHRGAPSGMRAGGGAADEAVQLAEALLAGGEIERGAAVLDQLLADLNEAQARGPRRGAQPGDTEAERRAHFLLGGARRRLGQVDEARSHYERVLESIGMLGIPDAYTHGLALLCETALAELAPDHKARLLLLEQIADGDHDLAADGLLRAVVARLAGAIAESAPERGPARTAELDNQAREHARQFAADYDTLVSETMRRKLHALADGPIYHAFTSLGNTGPISSLVVIRNATDKEKQEHHCGLVCLRFDLSLLLAEALGRFERGNAAGLTLVVNDSDDLPIAGAPPERPGDYRPTTLTTRYGLSLRAWPENLGERLAQAEAAATNKSILVAVLFLVASIGAIWQWRSAQREIELAKLKVDLVSRVSHELKTPLALIRMYGETLGLGRAKDSGQTAHFGGIIAREADRLTTMIQRLLDFSRQQAGTLVYAPQRVALAELLARVADVYRPHLESRGARLGVELQPDLVADVDPAALEGAVINLLDNAAKYAAETDAPDRSIDLVLTASGSDAAIEVRDRGRGVPAAELERVFDSFYRASNAGEVRGAGLGLSLVQHFAVAHGGRANAMPRSGGGSIFRITLPIAAPPS
jgi:signal transduction histidine kinase